ncbi:Activator of Hsp90 ATPase homolog 1-like protein [Prauserella alba]|uniref:Activator of Hsp90 ATPase homologue 1/2-like C-terminal domain-containing protein n=1 Tax=Prauserella alba TaxID=176898 RepID=A0ABN1VSL2_9PSEU|nr:Activator of Hsp90 ATPase homolog 1-like protein [Prauserella alba]
MRTPDPLPESLPGRLRYRDGFEDDAGPQAVTIVECEEPARLVVDLPSPEDTWRLQLSLTTNDDGSTTLVFIQRLAEPYDATGVGPGWHYYLDRLGAVIAHASVNQDWDTDYYPALSDAYPLPD